MNPLKQVSSFLSIIDTVILEHLMATSRVIKDVSMNLFASYQTKKML